MATRAQRIETLCEDWENNAAQAQERRTLKAALDAAQRQLALKDEAITLLRDCLAMSEADLDALRQIIAKHRVA